jgi:TonB family protein
MMIERFRFGVVTLLLGLVCVICSFAQNPATSPTTKEEIHVAGKNGVSNPKCVYCPAAEFTPKARKAKIQGTVTLSVVVGADGTVADAIVTKGLGYGLDESAVNTVKKWRLNPAADRDGNPVATKISVQVAFHMY